MIISLKTEKVALSKIFEIPIIGPLVVFLIALAPVPLMFIINELYDLTDTEFIERINTLITGVWNLFLAFGLQVKISFIFIPCWVLFIIIGFLRYFGVIGS